MKNFLFTISSLLFFSFTFSQAPCSHFRTGQFSTMEEDIVQSTFVRNDSLQWEKAGDIEISLKIEWIDDCSYRLIFIEGNEAFWNSRPDESAPPVLVVLITHTQENAYKQKTQIEGESEIIYEGVVYKEEW